MYIRCYDMFRLRQLTCTGLQRSMGSQRQQGIYIYIYICICIYVYIYIYICNEHLVAAARKGHGCRDGSRVCQAVLSICFL